MVIIHNPNKRTSPCVLVLGMFDGVHRGHQELLMRGAYRAQELRIPLVVSTFEPHPMEVLFPGHAPRRLTTLKERAAYMAEFGVDELCVTAFTSDVAATRPETFLEHMTSFFSPWSVICGYNYTFGVKGSGKPEELCAYGKEHGFETIVVDPVEIAGDTVSSTRIRQELEKGNILLANRLLGHAYTLEGMVDRRGEVALKDGDLKVLPGDGLYVGYLRPEKGRSRQSVILLGKADTEEAPHIRVRNLEACPELNGKTVNISLRDALEEVPREQKEIIPQDLEQARSWFERHA